MLRVIHFMHCQINRASMTRKKLIKKNERIVIKKAAATTKRSDCWKSLWKGKRVDIPNEIEYCCIVCTYFANKHTVSVHSKRALNYHLCVHKVDSKDYGIVGCAAVTVACHRRLPTNPFDLKSVNCISVFILVRVNDLIYASKWSETPEPWIETYWIWGKEKKKKQQHTARANSL